MKREERLREMELEIIKKAEKLFGGGIGGSRSVEAILNNMREISRASAKLVMNAGVCVANLEENMGEFRKWIASVHKAYGSAEHWERVKKISLANDPKKKSIFDGIEKLSMAIESDGNVSETEDLVLDLVGKIFSATNGNLSNASIK